uniref:CRAL-TRIO domain-containing protein n=1 Tax=Clastoptera arizonana TaxID=38151 RepID=A0A1B6E777_9HEMI
MKILIQANEEQRALIIKDIGYDEETMKAKKRIVKEWYKKQPHLPKILENDADNLIYSLLIGCKLRTEQAKMKLDSYFSYRNLLPAVYDIRDPTQEDVKQSLKHINYCTLPMMTPEGYRVDIWAYTPESTKCLTSRDYIATYKVASFISDIRMAEEEFCGGDFIVLDMNYFHFSSIKDMPIAATQKFILSIQEALPLRVKGIFVINAPPFIETLTTLLKPFLKEKAKQRLQIFSGDHTCLYQYIPKEMLPKEYGGNALSLSELSLAWQKAYEAQREWFLEDSKNKTNEKLRPEGNAYKGYEMYGIDGSFNKLTID